MRPLLMVFSLLPVGILGCEESEKGDKTEDTGGGTTQQPPDTTTPPTNTPPTGTPPSNPLLTCTGLNVRATLELPGVFRTTDLEVAGSVVYVAAGEAGGLLVVDASVPEAPVLAAQVHPIGPAYAVALDPSTQQLVAGGQGELATLDASDPLNPALIRRTPFFNAGAGGLHWHEGKLFAVDGDLAVYDLSAVDADTDPTEVSRHDAGLRWFSWQGQTLLGGSTNPDQVASWDLGSAGAAPTLVQARGDRAAEDVALGSTLVAFEDPDAREVVLVDAADFTQERGVWPRRFVSGLWTDDQVLVIAGFDFVSTKVPSVEILDIRDPGAPVLLASLDSLPWVRAMAVDPISGGLVVVEERDDGGALHWIGCAE